jgi:hypothetical protein
MSNNPPSPQPPCTISPHTQALIAHLIRDIDSHIAHSYIALFPRLRTRPRNRLLVLVDRYNFLAGVAISLFLHSFYVMLRRVTDLRTANALLIDEDNLRFAIADYWQDHDEFTRNLVLVEEGVVTWTFMERVRRNEEKSETLLWEVRRYVPWWKRRYK